MAVLQKIRKNLVAQLAIGLGMVAFIVTGLVTCSRGQHEIETVVTKLNGEELDRQDFDNQVEEYKNILRIAQNRPIDSNFTSEEEAQIREQVWQRFVQLNLLKTECEKLGLTVTDSELANTIKEGTHPVLTSLPLFVNQDRTFDYAGLRQFLVQYNNMNGQISPEEAFAREIQHQAWLFIEKELRNALLSEKYQNLLCALTLSNPVSAKANFEARHNETDITMAVLPYSTIADEEVKVSDSELKAKLEEYKNAYWRSNTTGETVEFYSMHDTREVKYIDVNVRPSQSDYAKLMDIMQQNATALEAASNIDSIVTVSKSLAPYTHIAMGMTALRSIDAMAAACVDTMAVGDISPIYENPADTSLNVVRLLAHISRPDSVEVRDIAIRNFNIAAAKATADSIKKLLIAGEPFDTIAKHFNQDGNKHWIYGRMFEGAVIDENNRDYIQNLITANTGDIKTNEFPGGIILSQITDRRHVEDKYDVAIIKRKIDFSQETFKQYMLDLTTFVNNCKDAKEIEDKALEAGYILQKETIYKNTHALARVNGTREIVRWAFNNETELGNILDPKAYGSNTDHIVVAILSAATPAGYATLDNEKVRDAIGQLAVRDKKVAMLQEKMKDAKSVADVAKLPGAVQDEIHHITFTPAAYVQQVGSQEYVLSGAATALAEGKFVAGLRGNAGVYAIQATKKKANAGTYDEKAELKSHAAQNASFVAYMLQRNPEDFNCIYYPVMKSGKMVDNRHIFF